MMPDQKSFTLRTLSFLGGGCDIVNTTFAHEGGQLVDYSLISTHRCLLMQDATTKIVDPPLKLICW